MSSLSSTPAAVLRFGAFELNRDTGELRHEGVEIRLPPQPARVLALLAGRAGQLVTRDEIHREIWGDRTFVDFERGLNFCLNRIRAALGDDPRAPRFIETLPRRGYRFIAPVEPVRPAPPTLAVLPFENLSHDPEQDYFADSIADALTTELGNVSTLRVISRHSVVYLHNIRQTLPEIAHQLKADLIVEGSVLHAAGRVRITAQLIAPDPERHLWARAYECALGDILTTQGQVARAIAEAIEVVLTPAEAGRLSRLRVVDPDAHLFYLKGRHYMGRWSRESFRKGLECLQLSLAKDPTHALACAQLANCFALLGFWGHMTGVEAYPKARHFALQAIALDDSLSAAHSALAWASWVYDWDLATCERETLRAIQLNPSDESAHVLYAVFLATTRGDRAGATRETRLALHLDPLSPSVNTSAAWIYLFAGDDECAIEQAHKSLELFPDAMHAYYVLGCAAVRGARYGEAIDALERAAAISRDAFSLAYLGHAHALAGHRETALGLLTELLDRAQREYAPPRSLVVLYAGLGDLDHAFEWLERNYEIRDAGVFFLPVMPLFAPLRSDARYAGFLRRLGLPPA